ncbi:extracellular solute-binding protein [Nonomuraea sp. NPDC001636]|uniref:extracellular solute-binding protein n=1 Tax=Nonomuraea sp. NPDC001636 TaxID=3154391 RepID=UPI0033262CE2
MDANRLGRRQLLQGALGLATLGTLGACGSGGGGAGSGSGSSSAQANARVTLPGHVPFTGLKADLPGTADGALPAFFAYPADPVKFTTEVPARGGTVHALCTMNTPPTPLAGNRYWQALNQALGAELKITGAPTADYVNKFQTMMAGGDLPDTMEVRANTPQLPGLLEAKFQELSEFLAGDKIKNYPGLANIPTTSWQSTVYNGGIYGIPIHLPAIRLAASARADIIAAKGLSLEIRSGAEFIALLKGLTEPSANKWAIDEPLSTLEFVGAMLGVANNWKVEGGRFTKNYEQPEMKKALEVVAGLWKDQVFHPDAFTATGAQKVAWMSSGATKIHVGASTWSNIAIAARAADPKAELKALQPPKFDGGGPAPTYLGPAVFSITGLKKAPRERIEEVLRVLNWLVSPFGTAEHRQRVYGVKDWDFTLKGTDPIHTDAGKSETTVPTLYIAASPVVHYAPGYPDITRNEYEAEKAALVNAEPWPIGGLYSATDQSQGATLDKRMRDLQADIIQGRKPVSAWDEGVAAWKSGGGDKTRAEYQDALQQSGRN